MHDSPNGISAGSPRVLSLGIWPKLLAREISRCLAITVGVKARKFIEGQVSVVLFLGLVTVVCAISVNSHYLQTRGKNRFFVLCRPSRLVTMVNFSVTAMDFYPKKHSFCKHETLKRCAGCAH